MMIGLPNLEIAMRTKLNAGRAAIAMAAHNQLAAKLAAEGDFDTVCGSGFELSASYAVLDATRAVAG
jgi:2-methylisocitrate lyase-like PEP mutase family enzyme